MSPELLRLLRETSRSFYLTLRVLPPAVRPQIGLAYLLARATDTIADTELVPVEERLAALAALSGRIVGEHRDPLDLSRLAASQTGKGSDGERRLLQRVEAAVELLAQAASADQALIREVLATITSGQELDLRRFCGVSGGPVSAVPPVLEPVLEPAAFPPPDETAPPPAVLSPPVIPPAAASGAVTALATDAELDDYTYRVAGCVGGFWTKLTRARVFPGAVIDDARFLSDGIRFGKGLQLVNILRDLPKDLRAGRCYIPASMLARVGLVPRDLLDPANGPRLRPIYLELLDRAQSDLEAGWRYTNTLPRGQIRLRLACAWPVLIGVKTIARLCTADVLDQRKRVKVSRSEVEWLLVTSVMKLPFRGAWERQFADHSG